MLAAEIDCAASGQAVEVAAVLDDLELALADGRVLRLAGIDPARATADRPRLGEEAREALQQRLAGRTVLARPLAAAPDRWDRTSALIGLRDGDDGRSDVTLNLAMMAAGWGRFRPGETPSGCEPAFLAAEAQARAGRLGLWADPFYALVSAGDADGLARRTGAMAIVEGTVGLHRSRSRTVLSLAGRGRSGLVALVAPRDEKRLAKAGLDLQKLVGREVRIRGFLDDRFGPRIDLVDPGQVEIVARPDGNRGAAPTSGVGDPDQNR